MGYFTIVLTSFTLLLAYAFLFNGAHAKLITPSDSAPSQTSNEMQKRPTYLLPKGFPLRRFKLYRRDFQALQPTDVEFIDDTINDVEKRYDDYGHMRFGKRAGPGDEGFDDYGHLRFGR
ncbi:hypothetical protein PVAND_005879 [Polypedilum vanderplanki]|uniref:Sulfakinin n=1 Tax=Polypedilum vanderplanki TaxID=319348 RepID=A0A9J6C2C4_POLVA|nr:hypothetical protein PVAND_005879 [Polypedilum vanderplanki]